eukprot:GHRR01006465.1.p1 GENE.GHRR01006465.1~~GHRR01006465.1.p1  ORF type:complete len:331 (+),score=36.50 GHRR01006465.1:234-1226(+)
MSQRQGKVALVAGAAGVTGRNLALALEKLEGWKVYGISRRPLDYCKKVLPISLDLKDKDKVHKSLSSFNDITHVYFCAYESTGDFVQDAAVNSSMFRNLVEGVEAAGCPLQHVNYVSGTKWYGNHIGPIKTPSREDDPRAMPPNPYYNYEDYVISRVKEGAEWSWSSVRPNPVCGFSTGNAMNLTMTLAVYASICKELGLPLRFPGSKLAYNALLEVTDASLLADTMVWCSTEPVCANTSFNVSNGDVFRWSEVWPKIAAWFGLQTATPQRFSMAQFMAPLEGTWQAMQRKHGLKAIPYKVQTCTSVMQHTQHLHTNVHILGRHKPWGCL